MTVKTRFGECEVRLIDGFAGTAFSDRNPLEGNNWRFLLLTEKDITGHILREVSAAINEMHYPACSHDWRRFIPACAGNANLSIASCSFDAVHPRMRGERGPGPPLHRLDRGSSPHARGTPYGRCAVHEPCRFIPACAGNAPYREPRAPLEPVHPRMRGERSAGTFVPGQIVGSSPHARGTLDMHLRCASLKRFIPACAGNASKWPLPNCNRSVHPRMRGERSPRKRSATGRRGSSPHARGTLSIVSILKA
jgi:hypothetical protein